MAKVKKTTKKDGFFHVRFRKPQRFSRIRTPGWAERVAKSESKGSKVRMGKTEAGNWLVQSVLIEAHPGKEHADARRLARRIRDEIED